MQINPERLQQLALLNPGPIERAIDAAVREQAAQQPAGPSTEYADVFGSPAAAQGVPQQPQAVPPVDGGTLKPKAPSMGPTPQQMQQMFSMINQQPQKPNFAPGAAVAPPPNLKFPQMPDVTRLMGGGRR